VATGKQTRRSVQIRLFVALCSDDRSKRLRAGEGLIVSALLQSTKPEYGMAQQIQTLFVDDLDGSDAGLGAGKFSSARTG
jgi:hypothetical protein